MKVFTNNVPTNCDYLTNGKYYEFEPTSSEYKYGYIIDDVGCRIFIITEKSGLTCAYLNDKAAWVLLNNTLLPGYDRPVSEAHIVDKELLQAAQQLAHKYDDWALANAALREAYGK